MVEDLVLDVGDRPLFEWKNRVEFYPHDETRYNPSFGHYVTCLASFEMRMVVADVVVVVVVAAALTIWFAAVSWGIVPPDAFRGACHSGYPFCGRHPLE